MILKICFFNYHYFVQILNRITYEEKKSEKELENLRSQLNDSLINWNADIVTYNSLVETYERNNHDLQKYISANNQYSITIENLKKQLEEANIK